MEALLMHCELKYEMAKLLCLFLVAMIVLFERALSEHSLMLFWKRKRHSKISAFIVPLKGNKGNVQGIKQEGKGKTIFCAFREKSKGLSKP